MRRASPSSQSPRDQPQTTPQVQLIFLHDQVWQVLMTGPEEGELEWALEWMFVIGKFSDVVSLPLKHHLNKVVTKPFFSLAPRLTFLIDKSYLS